MVVKYTGDPAVKVCPVQVITPGVAIVMVTVAAVGEIVDVMVEEALNDEPVPANRLDP